MSKKTKKEIVNEVVTSFNVFINREEVLRNVVKFSRKELIEFSRLYLAGSGAMLLNCGYSLDEIKDIYSEAIDLIFK